MRGRLERLCSRENSGLIFVGHRYAHPDTHDGALLTGEQVSYVDLLRRRKSAEAKEKTAWCLREQLEGRAAGDHGSGLFRTTIG